jgi:hypothetical protein
MKYEYKGLDQLESDLLSMEENRSLKNGIAIEYMINMSIEDRNKVSEDLTHTKYAFRASLIPPHIRIDRVIGPNGIVVNFKTVEE